VVLLPNGTNVATWTDLLSSGDNWSTNTDAGPTVAASFNGTGFPALQGNGTSFFLYAASLGEAVPVADLCVVRSPAAASAAQQIIEYSYGTSYQPTIEFENRDAGSLNAFFVTDTQVTALIAHPEPSLNAAYFVWGVMNGADSGVGITTTNTEGQLNNSTGSLSGSDCLFAEGVGGVNSCETGSVTNFANIQIAECVNVKGAIAYPDILTLHTNWCAIWGCP
jgi:hypothetical protein